MKTSHCLENAFFWFIEFYPFDGKLPVLFYAFIPLQKIKIQKQACNKLDSVECLIELLN